MDLDLRVCISLVGLSALLAALGGLSLVRMESLHRRAELQRTLQERADTLSLALQAKIGEAPVRTMLASVDALRGFRDEAQGIESVFIWKKGKGLVWHEGAAELVRRLGRDFKWMSHGKKSRTLKRGWLESDSDSSNRIIGWARSGLKDVWGIALDPNGNGCAENPRFMFALGACLVVVLGSTVVTGSLFLFRCARCARAEAERKSEFLSLLSHELRTPFAGMLPNLEMLLDGTVAEPEQRREVLKTVQAECLRANRMVSRLLEFSRLKRGMCRLSRETLDAVDAVRNVQAALGSRFECEGLCVSGEPKLSVEADYDALVEILSILLDNALKYASHAGPVEMNVGAGNGRALIRVMDRGPGLAANESRAAFEKFHRGENAWTKGSGLGIGLAYARELARHMRGDLTYRRREGGGAIFELELERSSDHG